MQKFLNLLKKTIEVIFIILFIFFEELVWKQIAVPLKNAISKMKMLDSTKAFIERQTAGMTVLIFLGLFVISEGIGIYSGILFVSGSFISGLLVYALRIPLVGFTFWVFSFTKEKLLTIDWFETLYTLLMRLINFITNTEVYVNFKKKLNAFKLKMKKLMKEKGEFSKEMNRIYVKMKEVFKDDDIENETKSTKSNKEI